MLFLVVILGYLLGSIPFALLIGKTFYKIDVRQHGSKNLGGTNAMRVLGKKPGAFVMLGDTAKGAIAVSLPLILNTEIHLIIPAIAAILGHCFPIFASFKGGKAVATTAGCILVIAPVGFAIGLATFIVTLKVSKFVSLSSILGSFAIFAYCLSIDLYLAVFSFFIFLLISLRHKENIRRIISNTEPKVTWI